MIGPSYLRCAAGVCVLAAALLMGAGGAVAVADPDSSGSTTASSDAKSPKKEPGGTKKQPPTAATSPKKEPGGTKKQPPTAATSPKKEAGGAEDETNDSGLLAAVTNPVAAVPNVVAPITDVVAPVPDVAAPVTNVVAPVPDVVAPVSDIIALTQDMLTSVAGAVVPLTQLQSDLYSFLLGIAGAEPVVARLGGVAGAGMSAAADASVASRLSLVLPLDGISRLPLAGISGVPLAGNTTGVATLDVIALGRASSLPGMAPLAPHGARPTGVQSFIEEACEVLLRASLWALAAVALPGAGGLVILTAAGVRVGYRQAKAGFDLRAAGIARFAGPGPLGVRSGSLVVVRSGSLSVVRPGALSAGCRLDEVA